MEILNYIQNFEDDFIAAGKLALELRKEAKQEQKFSTGFAEIDIVTSADLELQEFILSRLAHSELKKCELIAEEDTPSAKLFAKKSKYVLTLDPIDGTKLYATGKKMFSVVVTIHDKKRPIYTFCYYPAVDWGIKIVNDKLEYIGKTPKIKLQLGNHKKMITYWNRPGKLGPEKTDPKIYCELIDQGYVFITTDDLCLESGMKAPFLLEMTGGTFIEHDSAVDSLTELHFSIAKKLKIYNHYDLSRTEQSRAGDYLCYKGYYYVTR